MKKITKHSQNESTKSNGDNPIIGFIFEYGCDAPNKCEVLRKRGRNENDYEIERLVATHMKYSNAGEWDRIAKETGAEAIPDTRLTWYGWKYNATGWDVVWGIVHEKEKRRKQEQESQEEQERKIKKDIFRKAKTTNTPQVLSSWMAECNDPDEQCSLDHVTLLAMPDGSTKKKRQHTW